MTTPAESRGGTMPPRLSGLGSTRAQWFVFGPWIYDVSAAAGLLHAAPRQPLPLPVQPWACAYGLSRYPGSNPQAISLLGPGPWFDPTYAMTTDLDDPVIIATLTTAGGEPAGPLLIDGCHRLYKAAITGQEHLPSWWLTAQETLAIRRTATLGPGQRRTAGTENQP